VAPELASYDGAAHLQQGVALMITGLQSHFQPAPAPPLETAQQLVFLRFLKLIGTAVPDGLELHLTCDNYATRKTPAIKKWLLRHRRFHQQSPPCVCRSRFPAGPAG
jgi:hypothetical protein